MKDKKPAAKPKAKTTTKKKASKPKVVIPVETGRKSKYKPRYAADLITWMSKPRVKSFLKKESIAYDKDTGRVIRENREYQQLPEDLPTLEGFSHSIGVTYRTLVNWYNAKKGKSKKPKYPEFFHAYNTAKYMQKQFLINNALAGLSPPASYIFTAKNITDMRDKTEVDHTTDGQPMNFIEIDYSKAEAEIKRRQEEAEKKKAASAKAR